MGCKIVLEIKERFGHQTFLQSQGKQKGQVAVQTLDEENYLFYLVTKTKSQEKPKLSDICKS